MSPPAKPAFHALARARAAWVLVAGLGVSAVAWALLRTPPLANPDLRTARAAAAIARPAPGTAQAATALPMGVTARSPWGAARPVARAGAIRAVSGADAASGAQAVEVTIRRDETLDGIFHRLRLSLADLAAVRSLPGIRADIDRLRPGESLTLLHRGSELLGLTRRLSLAQTLQVTKVASGYEARLIAHPLETRTRTISGTIDHSLFEAVDAAGGHDSTTLALADIFAWDIDFVNELRPGDTFTVTYQEVYDHGKYAQDGPILAARFVNAGHEYLAVRYVAPGGHADYYTPDGRSLRKAFLRAPLKFTRVSSPFNLHRYHPILHLIRAHKGIDYAAPIGTPVHAAGDGRVAFVGRKGGYGNVVELDHAHGIMTIYGHLSRFARGLRVGEHVDQGAVIAYVGMTGLATGPHLHFEFRVHGVAKNPQTVPLPDAAPIDAGLRADFLAQTGPLLGSLFPPVGPALVSR